MFKLIRKTEAFIDISNLALGGFLFLSPWIFGFTSDLGWHTSWIAGTAITIIAIFSIGDLFAFGTIPSFIETEEWLNLAIGLWLAACPWILRFHGDTVAMQVHLAVGLVIAAPLVRVSWLAYRWWRWGDRRFASVAASLLLVVGTGTAIAVLTR